MKTVFWISLGIIIYTYAGYTVILFLLVQIKKIFTSSENVPPDKITPEVSLFITAYNEAGAIHRKMDNSLRLDYPENKLKIVWVTDGSDDDSHELLSGYKNVTVLHEKLRKGKIHAMNRGMQYIKTPIVVFSDANTLLNRKAIKEIVKLFQDKKVGCVSGEKRIFMGNKESAVSSGEGIYWQYESLIKKLESDLNSTVGAAGELFAIRTELYSPVKPDIILDDFMISLNIAGKGYKIKYTPLAFAEENASLNIQEEEKRKIRIASGGIQTFIRTPVLLNPFRYGFLAFQYFSHKVLRWIFVPLSFIIALFTNVMIVVSRPHIDSLYAFLLIAQCIYYLLVFTGWLLRNNRIRLKLLFLPYYLYVMNFSILKGIFRYITGSHTVLWEKSNRAD